MNASLKSNFLLIKNLFQNDSSHRHISVLSLPESVTAPDSSHSIPILGCQHFAQTPSPILNTTLFPPLFLFKPLGRPIPQPAFLKNACLEQGPSLATKTFSGHFDNSIQIVFPVRNFPEVSGAAPCDAQNAEELLSC